MAPKKDCLDESIRGATPRSGGFVRLPSNLEHSHMNNEDENTILAASSIPNENSSMTKLESDWDTEEVSIGNHPSETQQSSGMSVIGNLISVIMILASGNTPPPVELMTAINYLNYIKDEEGNVPPNVQGILNHLDYLGLRKY